MNETQNLLENPISTVFLKSKWKKYSIAICSLIFGIGIYMTTQHSTNLMIPHNLSSLSFRSKMGQLNSMRSKTPLIKQCTEKYYTQIIDHFGRPEGNEQTYQQRYFVCSKNWKGPNAPIFFYVGNEANVELYLNHTGLMWENAEEFGAMMVFAEHRYFGKSIPFGSKVHKHMKFLSSEQALGDYATLIRYLKHEYETPKSSIIAFGGSYGGMLASWFRMKYPHIISGAIAGSAPILSFPGETPQVNPYGFSEIITKDASSDGGSKPECSKNIRKSWKYIFEYGKTEEGRHKLTKLFRLCKKLKSLDEVKDLANAIQDAYGSLAMGNYPYPSSYIMNGDSNLPAYPVRVACSHLGEKYSDDTISIDDLLSNLRESVSIYFNSTGTEQCYTFNQPNKDSQKSNDYWGYLYCTEMCQPFSTNGQTDMFWPKEHNWEDIASGCMKTWGVTPRLQWATTVYGGRKALKTASNIVFTNGNYDPWTSYGVTSDISTPPSVVSIMIEGGAHHLDLMFSHPLDPQSVKNARIRQKQEMWKWIKADESFATIG